MHGGAQNAHTWDTVALALGGPLRRGRPARSRSLRLARRRRVHAREPGRRRRRRGAQPCPRRVGWSSACRSVVSPAMELAHRHPGARAPVDARRHHPRREPGQGQGGASTSSTGRRRFPSFDVAARPDHRAQPDPERIVAAARDPAQRPSDRRRARGSGATTGAAMPAPAPQEPETPWRPDPSAPCCRRCGTTSRAITCPLTPRPRLAVAGGRRRRRCRGPAPSAGLRVEVVEGAGHSIQGDRPLELAALIALSSRRLRLVTR